MRTVSVRYKSLHTATDAQDVAMYLSELLRANPNGRFYLIVAENRMFAVGAVKDEKSERWTVRDFRYIRDDEFRPYFLYFSPSELPQGEYATIMYGGIKGKVEREHPSAPLYFYLTECDLRLTTEQQQAGATKEAVWEIFKVDAEAGVATIRPLLSDGNPLMVIDTINAPYFGVYRPLCDFITGVLTN